jgi:hypothetical protein
MVRVDAAVVGASHHRPRRSPLAVPIFCTKCRVKRDIEGPEAFTTSNGKDALRGTCPVCGTRVVRMGALKPA